MHNTLNKRNMQIFIDNFFGLKKFFYLNRCQQFPPEKGENLIVIASQKKIV